MKTMKIMRRLMGCAAAILALTACSESEDLLAHTIAILKPCISRRK